MRQSVRTMASVTPQAPRWKSSGTRLAKRKSSIVLSAGQLPPYARPTSTWNGLPRYTLGGRVTVAMK